MTRSRGELHFSTLLKTFGICGYVIEHTFHPKRKWRFDYAFLNEKVAVEVDGGQWKAFGGRHSRDADRHKINSATVLGWRVLRFSPEMLKKDGVGCIITLCDSLGIKNPMAEIQKTNRKVM